MSDQDLPCADLYARPAEIDEGTYLRIRQIRPVERAASPIIDHNIELTETALTVRPWYRGETRVEPGSYMSILLDPGRNNAVCFLDAFAQTVKEFPPGAFPGHCRAVRELEFTSAHLINALSSLMDAAVFALSLRHLGALFAAFSDPANRTLSAHDLRQRIDSRLGQLVDSFRAISREFVMREREILFRSLPSEPPLAEKADEILAVATETRQIARETQKVTERIDAREVKRGKRRQDVEMQDRCFGLWESGRAKECVRSAANGKVSYEAVFNYYRRELEAMGVTSSAQFTRALTNRAKRLSRVKSLAAREMANA